MAIDAALGRLGIKSGVCTSSTRPTNPYSGQIIYETDTNRTLVYDNSAWLVVADNQVLSIDPANGRVGVNDTSPSYALDVTGDINASGDLRIGGTAYTNRLGSGAAVRTLGTFVGGDVLQAAELNAIPSDAAQILFGCTNGGGWLYNPADVGYGYYSPSAGATVTMTTGTLVLVMIHADWGHATGITDYWSVNVTGATTIAPNDANAIVYTNANSHRITTGIAFCLTVNAGTNTFQNKMKNVAGSYAQTVYYNRLQIVRLN